MRVSEFSFGMCLCLLTAICSCGVLANGISYQGQEKVFHTAIGNTQTFYREAQGREPGWELGIAFKALADGRINGLHVKNPTRGIVPITIWDGDTKQIIQQFNTTLDGTDNYNKIYMHQPVKIQAGKTYRVTINVMKFYYQSLPFFRFPMNAENVQLLGSVYEETHYTRFPEFLLQDVFHGMIDVDLQWVIK